MKWRNWLVLVCLTLLIVPPAIFAAWAWATLQFSYSKGERSGFLQKISEKGWVCKTWEGELAMVNLPGAMPEIFHFSVRDPAIFKQIQMHVGQRVSLGYDEHRFVPTSCFGETSYFVSHVRSIADVSPTK